MNETPTIVVPRTLDAPYDLAAVEAAADWRDHMAWPVSFAESFALGRRLSRALLGWLNAEGDDDRRDTVLLAAGFIMAYALAVAERALAVDGERRGGVRFPGSVPELDYLRGVGPEAAPPALDLRFGPPMLARPRHTILRRIARVASWSSGPALARRLLAPEAVAISHNALLRDCARQDKTHVGFRHAEEIYADIRQRSAGVAPVCPTDGLADEIAQHLSVAAELSPDVGRRFHRLVLSISESFIAKAARELAAARNSRLIPTVLWSGSAGYWPARCIAIEALRRGHEVRRFEHGSEAGMIEVVEPIAISELSVTSEFTCATPHMAARLERTGAAKQIWNFRRPRIGSWRGDPNIRALDFGRRTPKTGQRRVLYGPNIMLGPRQLFPPILPDPIHLDWQFRLIEALQEMPIEIVCRPHPEGFLHGRPNPLAALVAMEDRRYEELIPEADVMVFDYGQSTTFYEALCSDRPVVFIDFGNPLFTEGVRNAVARRCRVVRARFDDRNRPHIDAEELAEAVCGGPDQADPGEFRAMLLEVQ